MKIGSWLSPFATSEARRAQAPVTSGVSEETDRVSRAGGQSIGLGNGYSLGVDGKVVKESFWGKPQKCSRGESVTVLEQAYQRGQVSADEIRSTPGLTTVSSLITGQPSEALTDKLKSWPEGERAQFNQLLNSVGTEYREQGEQTFFLGAALEKLALQDKLLEQKDHQGHSLLTNLLEMQKTCQSDGQVGKDLFAWTVVHSAYSKRSFHQVSGKGTCGAATIGYVLWQESPARVVRALRDWAYEGKTQTRTGVAERPLAAYDPAQPSPLADQVLQASLMNLADPECVYDIVQDQFSKQGQQRERGLFPEHQQHLLNSLSAHDWQSSHFTSAELQPLLRQGSGPIPVALNWTQTAGLHSRHLIAVSRVTDRHVYMRDPAGDSGLTLENSTQEKLGQGFLRMDRQEFDSRVQQGLLPGTF